jgi:hypothetical protein
MTKLHSFLGLTNFYHRFMLGFSHIAWALSQVTKSGLKAKFIWVASQQKSFEDLEFCFCSTPILILPDPQQPFDIETYSLDYAIGAILTRHGHSVAYHNETLSDVVHRYPTYDKEMYSIMHVCRQRKNWILETFIHTDQRPLQFMQTQGNLKNDCHKKWSTYLQKFHFNIKYKNDNTNHVADCVSRPPIVLLTTVLNSSGHETSGWPQLYNNESYFATTYQTLSAGKIVPDFHLQDRLLFHLSHLCVPSSKRAKLIWEAHYSWAGGHVIAQSIVWVKPNPIHG